MFLLFADKTSVDIKYICSFFYVDSSMLDSATDLIHIFDNILRGLKNKSHSYKIRVWNSEDIHCQISALKMTKVRKGVDILDKRIL